jgi:hypothetical protein
MKLAFTVEANGLEYCDYSFMCMTGGLGPWGLDYERGGWMDWDSGGLIIGALDAPLSLPAGGMEFIDNPLMRGVFAQVARRDNQE